MSTKINIFLVLRILIGLLFLISGAEKLINPLQNFLYVVQSYELLPSRAEGWVAHLMPWCEFFVGLFLVLGLWLKNALRATLILFCVFIFVIGQALIRKLAVTECGCFGELISFPLPVTLMMDSTLLAISGILLLRLDKTSSFSLDNYFLK